MERRRRHALIVPAFVLSTVLQTRDARCDDTPLSPSIAQSAAKYLDERSDWWLNWSQAGRGQRTACVSCHTALPLALARAALAEPLGESAAGVKEQALVDNVTMRVANWEAIVSESGSGDDPLRSFYSDRVPASLGTEAVLNALVLVNHDVRRAKGVVSAPTRDALRHLWEQQQPDGAWLWLDFGLNPWENDAAYYGASLAAVAVGMAGEQYYDQAEVQENVAALRKYLNKHSPSQPLHHRALALWASSFLPHVLTENDRIRLVAELLAVQQSDGGWSLAALGDRESARSGWEARARFPDGAESDGYATGLVVLACKSAGVDDARLQKGFDWLCASQREGTWPATYLNQRRDPDSDIGKFMRDASTAFAVLALTQP
jgi:squalene-hopene/tetraprenyl-beta-curcumene cyclase